jgi:Glycosyltransferase family 87
MSKARLDGLYLMLIGCAVFLGIGLVLESASPKAMADFKTPYYAARCLLQHGDPYAQSQVLTLYYVEKGPYPGEIWKDTLNETRFVYQPTLFLFTLPLATLSIGPAHLIWLTITLSFVVLASFLAWDLAADYAPVISAALIAFVLSNSELLVVFGNPAGLAIGLSIVAVWCFYRNRFWLAGTLCMAFGLLIKPHDVGPVWLYFFLAGGLYRKRALQSLAFTVTLGLPAVFYVTHLSPHWISELRYLLSVAGQHGGINDPGPASSGEHGLVMLTNLQTALSIVYDNPHFYNPVTYLVCVPLFVVWLVRTVRSRISPMQTWLALAIITPFELVAMYHRQYDALILLLAIPAFAMLSSQPGLRSRHAVIVTAAALVVTGNIFWTIFYGIIGKLQAPVSPLSEYLIWAANAIPIPIVLLVTVVFYLRIYVLTPGEPVMRNPAEA